MPLEETDMRAIDAAQMEVVCVGLPWKHAISPCSKQAINLLERNTKVVTWLVPRGGTAQDQIPCIFYKDRYYSLSLRMQKAIYRHIRLKKGFKNEETVNGMQKLRIPDLLLKEKIRTQSRFDAMRSNHQNAERRERTKSVNTVAARMKQVVEKLIQIQKKIDDGGSQGSGEYNNKHDDERTAHSIPMDTDCDGGGSHTDNNNNSSSSSKNAIIIDSGSSINATAASAPCHGWPQITVFVYKSQQSEITNAFFQEIQKENPTLFRDRSTFLGLIAARYDEFMHVLSA